MGDRAETRKRRHLIGLSVAGVGGAMLGAGALFGYAARSNWNRSATDCGGSTNDCVAAGVASAQGHLDDARSEARWSTALIGVGCAAVVTGLIVYLAAPTEHQTASAWRVVPVAGTQAIGLVVSGELR